MPQADASSALHLALERISSLFRAQMRDTANRHDLKLVQLEAVVYLSVANRYSDTAVALGDYLGLTKGTVSQTIRALEQRGLLEKVGDSNDGRVLHCQLTPAGHGVAREAHPASFLRGMSADHASAAIPAALTLLRALQAANQFRTFGTCRTCRHFDTGESSHRCGLTGESLCADDADRICREHAEPSGD